MMQAHVVGAGVAGLAAAVHLAEAGVRVAIYDAAPEAGGRCRSFSDATLERTIDNGGHVLLGANRRALAFLRRTGGADEMAEIAPARFPFLDLASGERWTLAPGPPWWPFSTARRPPGVGAFAVLGGLRLICAGDGATVADVLGRDGAGHDRLWAPLATAIMNADPAVAAAQPFARALALAFGGGDTACRPWLARRGLSAAFVDPALHFVEARGGSFRGNMRSLAPERNGTAVTALRFADGTVVRTNDDGVVLALPSWSLETVLPEIGAPSGASAIVNAHFLLPRRVDAPSLVGLIGGMAQWLILRDDVASVTVSGADALLDRTADDLLSALWPDAAGALGLSGAPRPPGRLIKERRATFAQTPANCARRPGSATRWRNLVLAGDWTDTGLPATIEGAVRSGEAAAALLVRRFR